MNKTKKIAVAVVSMVMAGSMALSVTACGGGPAANNDPPAKNIVKAVNSKAGISQYETYKQKAWAASKQYHDEKLNSAWTAPSTRYKVADDSVSLADVELRMDIGDADNRSVSFSYGGLLAGTVRLPDNKEYKDSSLKPAWAALDAKKDYAIKDVWSAKSKKFETALNSQTDDGELSGRDILTDGAQTASDYQSDLLNLNDYLDYMPNYKKFLEDNPIVRLSLTSNTSNGAMYYAPYFDGYDDIEKYELFKTNWVKALLDNTTGGDATTTYKSHADAKEIDGTSAKITSFMGTTGSYHTDVLDYQGKKLAAGITVNYDKALAAAQSETAELGKAIKAAADVAYTGESGNIVDLMNFVINEKQGEVTGAKLLKILQEYIKVAYYEGDANSTTAMYGRTNYALSDVFVGHSAAWDVDLYAALGRVLVTNPSLLLSGKKGSHIGGTEATPLSNLWLLCARQNNMQRMSDTISMVGQLYGVRGLESKNLYAYIESDGKLADVRNVYDSYDAMALFSNFWAEGLVTEGSDGKNGSQSYYTSTSPEALSTYDYVNTQTPAGFIVDTTTGVASIETQAKKYNLEEGYNYTPIITPVSRWNDGQEKYMRFTESWRTTKDTGFLVPKVNVENNPKKLRAVLDFIDFMFSPDGQILMTYGPMAEDATGKNGFWYNREATAAEVTAGTYFTYEGKKLYSEVQYGGVYQPTPTAQMMNAYYGQAINNFKFDGSDAAYYEGTKPADDAKKYAKDEALPAGTLACNKEGKGVAIDKAPVKDVYVDANNKLVNSKGQWLNSEGKAVVNKSQSAWITDATLNYTNFARYVIGSALPLGNKLQSFEFQLTSKMGREGALVVDNAINEGIILHTQNKITDNPWYTVTPTVLPYTTADLSAMQGKHKAVHGGGEGMPYSTNKNDKTNLYFMLIQGGYSKTNIEAINTKYSLTIATNDYNK